MVNTNIQSFSGDVEVTSNLSVDTNTLYVDSVAGRVGIGKTDPGFALDVSGTVNATALYVGGSEFASSLWSSNASNLYYTTGAVGIGTDFPQKDLEVQGTLRLSNAATGETSDLVAKNASNWDYQQKIIAPDAYSRDHFAQSVSISGDGSYALVGVPQDDDSYTNAGSVYIYVRSGSSWAHQQKITAPDAQQNNLFGTSVSISDDGSYALAGASGDDDDGNNSGSAYIYVRSGSSWSYQAKITAPDAGANDYFGQCVSISGDGSYALVGAHRDDAGNPATPQAGSAYIFSRSGSSWSYQDKLTAPDAASSDLFGYSVSISDDGSWVIVGAYLDYTPTALAGSAYFYSRSGSSWTYQQKITAPTAVIGDNFGISVSISGDGSYAIAGAIQREGTPAVGNAGAAYIYVRSGSSWGYQAEIKAPDRAPGDRLGQSVSISKYGSHAIVGTIWEDAGGAGPQAGSAYIFSRSGSSWSYQDKLTAPDAATQNYFGYSISISDNGVYVIVGAPSDDYSGAPSGYAYFYSQPTFLSTTTPIEAAGTLLSFTGQHICFPEGPMSQGLVVSANKNKYVTLNGPLKNDCDAIRSSESLPVVSLSNVANDRSAFGVVDHFENGGTSRTQTSGATVVRSDKELGDNRVIVNSLGEGAMWIANTNGSLESGDYITTSNIAGYGQKQEDDTVHSYTVAKITMDCDFDPEDVPLQVIKKDENGQNVLDEYGRIQWEEVPDQTEKAYNIRYLTTDGGVTDEANAVWKAAYVGCTYHCG